MNEPRAVIEDRVPTSFLQATSAAELPDDVELLKAMVLQVLASNEELTHQVAWLKRALWGKKSEKLLSPQQMALFEAARARLGMGPEDPEGEGHDFVPPEDIPAPAAGASSEQATDSTKPTEPGPEPHKRPETRRGGRRATTRGKFLGGTVPEDLPVRTRHICLAGAACPVCGAKLTLLGADARKRVEYQPGHFFILETLVETGICQEHPSESLFTPEGPDFIVPGGILGNELLCKTLVDKHADGLPLHRQSARYARKGIRLRDSTLSRNVIKAAELGKHLVHAMRNELLASPWLQGDATGLPILVGTLGQAHPGQLWVYSNGETAVFQASMTKHGAIPRDFLDGFQGVWLSDGASNDNEVAAQPGVERAGCWSHGRRYVFEARDAHFAAFEGLALIRDLFLSERTAMLLAPPERLLHRTEAAAPIVARIWAWVDAWRQNQDVVQRPKSPFAKALNYLHRQRAALDLFLTRPEIELHNNRSELLLRGPVIGRKAWLFAGSPEGADASAVWFSIMASCMLQGIDPMAYLRDVLPTLAKRTPSEVRDLTPARWAARRAGVEANRS